MIDKLKKFLTIKGKRSGVKLIFISIAIIGLLLAFSTRKGITKPYRIVFEEYNYYSALFIYTKHAMIIPGFLFLYGLWLIVDDKYCKNN